MSWGGGYRVSVVDKLSILSEGQYDTYPSCEIMLLGSVPPPSPANKHQVLCLVPVALWHADAHYWENSLSVMTPYSLLLQHTFHLSCTKQWQAQVLYQDLIFYNSQNVSAYLDVDAFLVEPLALSQSLGSAASRNFEKGARSRTHFQKVGQPEYFWATHPFNAKHPFNIYLCITILQEALISIITNFLSLKNTFKIQKIYYNRFLPFLHSRDKKSRTINSSKC